MRRLWDAREALLLAVAASLLVAGAATLLFEAAALGRIAWSLATALGLAYSTAAITAALRRRQPSVDLIAWLAMAGALLTDEPLAGAVIAVMLFTGGTLEARASAHAERSLRHLAARAPRLARREGPDGVDTIPVGRLLVGDRIVVGTGELVPVDGRLLEAGVFDESALTGEALPVEHPAGDDIRSGVANAGNAVRLVATETAERSTYTGVVRLVEQTQASTAPFVRVADRFASAFVPLTLVVAGLAWALSGEAVRAVAVLVVATPCPLLLAAPIAITAGLSRAAGRGAMLKGGSALERLADGRVLLLDKTGTLTRGRPVLVGVVAADGFSGDEVLRAAASLDQMSAHVLASAVVTGARDRGLEPASAEEVRERPGYGVEGIVEGHRVRLGKSAWVIDGPPPSWARRARRRASLDGSLTVYIAVDGRPAGVLLLADPLRPDAPRMMRTLREAGITRTVLITGDRADMAETVGRLVGADAVFADRDPSDKLDIVRAEQDRAPTIMVGDGVNDAPALAAAGAGVAMGARGAGASAEAADVVLTTDRIDGLADAILIARRSIRIARRAAGFGMALSLAAMAPAAAGMLAPAAGAILQEAIDVAAIALALTALLPGRVHTVAMPPADLAVVRRLHAEHTAVAPLVERIREVADGLDDDPPDSAPLRELVDRLETELLPHERAEEVQLVPIVADALGPDPFGALSRSHAEIEHRVRRLRRACVDIGDPPEPDEVTDLRGALYGLYAIVLLHNAQEEENAFSLMPVAETARKRRVALPAGPRGGRRS
ncbi:heavy metal translocating P-type ATPase [Glycomyces harbinensis]|uniref:ATPase, P-type (Transporting), HAD superfamily, subfamily IC/heavy metal translocating P-type ATPase n=1 Tax=Glycomyces harbinensis TaxID=58114 RepID=A0A1G6XMY4_9ACTN|nr:heavy metal translocating P-type ATPase [Glycomyces harbinensis]SDD79538.1 ATPase, P-type (transporting), HAD superfamily, subfamily IC/heavy metal translocating P-type ATPase [Glycomyces harbinensis]